MNNPGSALAGIAAVLALAVSGCATTGATSDVASVKPGTPAATPAAPNASAAGVPAATTRPAATRPAATPPTSPTSPTPPIPTTPGAPRPFAEVIKDAKEIPGFFRVWRKDEKVWLEIASEQFDQPLFMAVNLSRGLGERWLLGGLMGANYAVGGDYLVELRKAGTNVQLIARNTTFTANPGSPEAFAVRDSFSDSLLGSAPVASAPHPERKSILIEANTLLLRDIPRGQYILERAYRNGFAFDAANSYFGEVKSSPERTTLDITAHYAQSRIPLPPPPVPGQTQPAPFFPPPAVTPDPRSLFLGYLYTFTKLPEQPMRPRIADPRLGHFTQTQYDFSSETSASPRRHLVQRWRLEKKEPNIPVSEPVKPITFWLGREIPTQYRKAITDGVLEWNKAFERIGFKDAIVVRQQAADADFDTLDSLHSSIRWMTTSTPTFGAIGPSHTDPRTGEIIDADIGWDANMTRAVRFQLAETGQGKAHGVANALDYTPMYDPVSGAIRVEAFGMAGGGTMAFRACTYMEMAAREYGFAFALLQARGEIDPNGAEAEAFVNAFLKDVTMHEIGHTLGLSHNFRASTIHTAQQLADPEFTKKNGLTGSVMEYSPTNLSLKDERPSQAFTETLGAYDYWAIEYAYKPIAPDAEAAELARIAARSHEPQLAFGNDFDNIYGLDPEVNIFDLGSDPIGYWRRRVSLSRELWQNLEQRQLKPGESYNVLRRRFLSGFANIAQPMAFAAKYIGGISMVHDHAGSPRTPLAPVPVARQREALALITDGLFRSSSFKVTPDLMRRLAINRLEVEAQLDAFSPALPGAPLVPIADMILAVQRDVLNRLMSPVVASQLMTSTVQAAGPAELLSIAELYGTLQNSIWEEARKGSNADLIRRNVQREHLRKLTTAITGPAQAMPADARALMRAQARRLRDQLAVAQKARGLDAETRAHFAESHEALNEALKATMVRSSG